MTNAGFTNGAISVSDAATSRTNLGVPSTTGSGASGTWPISISGSSGSVPNALTVSTGLALNSGTTYDGSAARTISIDNTVVTLSGSQVLTNKTLTSPTLSAPVLGTPASGTLTNCTGYNANNLSGTTLNSGVTASSLTSLGTLSTLTVTNGTSNTFLNITAAGSTTYAVLGLNKPTTAGGGSYISMTENGTEKWVAGMTNGDSKYRVLYSPTAANYFVIDTSGHITVEGVTSTGATGTGKFVFDTSPVLSAPALGTPVSGVLTNCTGTASGLTAGNVTTNANLTGPVTSSGNATTVVGMINATTVISGTSQSAAINNAYYSNNAGLVTITLPNTAAVGSIVEVGGLGAGGWRIAQNASQLIHLGSSVTTTGTGGRLDSTNQYDSVTLRCVVANTTWNAVSVIGNITVT